MTDADDCPHDCCGGTGSCVHRYGADDCPGCAGGGGVSDLERFDVALRDIAYDVEKLGDFIRRPDLNADNIRLLDSWGKKLHELVAESTALLDRVDAARALCAGHTGRTHDTYDEGWVDALNHIADALGGSS